MEILIGVAIFIYLISSNRSLSNRLNAVESKLKNGLRAGEVKTEPINIAGAGEILKTGWDYGPENQAKLENISKGTNPTLNNNLNIQPPEPNKFAEWLKEDWLMKLGAGLFIIGFGWFVSYAFINNWIGPVGRISIGIVAGVIIMALGFRRMMKYPSQGALFMALGAGMAMLTIFAGRSIYDFFTPASAVFFDFIIAAFVSFASYKFNVQSLAFVAQVLAFITPLLAAGKTDSVFLFSYLLFVSLASLLLASVTGWRDLIVSSLIFVGFYSIPYIGGYGFLLGNGNLYINDAPMILNFAYLFSIMYLFSGMFAVAKKGVQDAKNEIILAVLNGLFIFLWIYNVASKEWNVLIFSAFAVIFAVSSFIAYRFSAKLAPFYAYGSVAVAFIAAATSAQLNGASLVIAFTMEVLLIVLSILLLTRDIKATTTASWLFIVPVILSLGSVSSYANSRELFSSDFYVLAFIAATLIITGRVITSSSHQKEEIKENNFGSALVVIGTLYIGYIIWQFVHILMSTEPDIATMTTLIIYTIFGLIAYFAGLYGNDMARKTYGMVLLAFVVFRLIFVDVWNMELFGRVITFLAIGILLMSTAFLTKKKKNG